MTTTTAMKVSDAAKLLALTGEITPDIVNTAYREAAKLYHPDRNPAGKEMMILINAAYEVLHDYRGDIGAEGDGGKYPEALNAALNAIIALTGLNIEVCGAWVWVSGETRRHKEALKAANFKYASQKQRWYFRPEGWRSASRGSYTMDEIRTAYGSSQPNVRRTAALGHTTDD